MLGALTGIFLFIGGMAGAARLTHNPEGLAAVLEKLIEYSKRLPLQASRQTTRPPIEERVGRLRAMRLT